MISQPASVEHADQSACRMIEVAGTYDGLQRRTGLRAASASSSREILVECGADLTISGLVAASSAMAFMASTKLSRVSTDSVSVGSIIKAPGTIKGK